MALAALTAETLLGFDTETRPAFRKGQSFTPALVQLAGATCVYLFQLNRVPFDDALAGLLANPGIVKAGVAVRDDIKALQALTDFEPGGFLDLGDQARDLGLRTNGLRNLSANFLGFRISKGAQRSNWDTATLTPKQVNYAATDAWVSRELCLRLATLGLVDLPRPGDT